MAHAVKSLLSFVLLSGVAATGAIAQDVTHTGDVTVTGNFVADQDSVIDASLCIGNSCSNTPGGEVYTNDISLRFKYTTNAIEFIDTSSVTAPGRDWRIRVNDVNSFALGGIERFSIEDIDASTTPFTIVGAAPNNAIWVAASGDVGLGTSLPTEDLHIAGGSKVSIRMQRSAPVEAWDMVTESQQWYLSDATNGTTPFRVEAAADTNTLVLDSGNAVGMGTAAPTAALHLLRFNGSAKILVENAAASPSAVREMFAMKNNGGSYFTLDNTVAGTSWYFLHENASPNRFIISDAVNDGPELSLTAEGNLTIQGQLFTAGSCASGCDRVFDADYPLPSIADQAAMMRTNRHLPAVGPTPENGPFNLTAMTGGMLNELEKAHLYIAQLHETLAVQQASNTELAERVARLEALLPQGRAEN